VDTHGDKPDKPKEQPSRSDGMRSTTTPPNDLVSSICVDGRHQAIGRSRPDGSGHITFNGGKWAYCAAALGEEPHVWAEIAAQPLDAIHHSDAPGG
jgi:hypothetical protein